jgi:hypothetical protein
MIRLLLLAIILIAVLGAALYLIFAARKQAHLASIHAAFERDMQALALEYVDIAPSLAKAVLDRIRIGRVATLAHPAHTLGDDLINLALEHRAKDPEFATILTDSIRTWSPETRLREID